MDAYAQSQRLASSWTINKSLSVSKHVPSDSALVRFVYYNPCTIGVLRASWSFFRLAFQGGAAKGEKISILAETKNLSQSLML